MKRLLRRLDGRPELVRAFCELRRGDARAQSERARWKVEQADDVERTLDALLAEGAAFCVRDLSIGGRDVMALGVPPGPLVGAALEAALDAVVDEARPERGARAARVRPLVGGRGGAGLTRALLPGVFARGLFGRAQTFLKNFEMSP